MNTLPASNIAQQLFLSLDGHVIESDNKLILLEKGLLITHNRLFQFLEGIFDIIQQLELGAQALVFPRVQSEGKWYDVSFEKMIFQNELVVLCNVIENIGIEAIQEAQQKYNLVLLQEELR